MNGVPERAFATDWNNFGPRARLRLPPARQRRETVIRGGAGIFYGPTVSNTIGDVGVARLLDRRQLRRAAGRPAERVPPPRRLPRGHAPAARRRLRRGRRRAQAPITSVGFFDPQQVAPISYQYNLNVQREVARDLLVEVGYIGNVSHHLTANDLTLNQVAPQLMGAGRRAGAPAVPAVQQRDLDQSLDRQLDVSRRLRPRRKAPQRAASRSSRTTRSRSSSTTWKSANELTALTGSYMDAYNRRLDKGLSGSDVPHRAVRDRAVRALGLEARACCRRWSRDRRSRS